MKHPQGIKPDEGKVKSNPWHAFPKEPYGVEVFRFSPVIAQTSEPVRQLMKKEVPFVWQEEHQKVFQNLKLVIIELPVLVYYDSEKDNLVQSDVSLKGIGVCWYKMVGQCAMQVGR